jgi:hypothetical protein
VEGGAHSGATVAICNRENGLQSRLALPKSPGSTRTDTNAPPYSHRGPRSCRIPASTPSPLELSYPQAGMPTI